MLLGLLWGSVFILIAPSIRLLWGYIKDSLTPPRYLRSKIKLSNNVSNVVCELSELKFRHLLEKELQQGMIFSLRENSSNVVLIQKSYPKYSRLHDRILNWDKKLYELQFKPKY